MSPQTRRIESFSPSTRGVFTAASGGVGLPLIVLLVTAPALAVLSRLWVTEAVRDSTTDSLELAAQALALLFLAFLCGSALARICSALVGRRRYGTAELTLAGGTGVIGTGLHGDVRLSWPLKRDESAVVVLECTVMGESVEGMSSVASYRWFWEAVVDAADITPGLEPRIPIRFTIPETAPPSGSYKLESGPGRQVVWTLTLTIEPNTRPDLTFVVPMAAGPHEPEFVVNELDDGASLATAPPRPAGSRIAARPNPEGGSEYRFPLPVSTAPLAWWAMISAPAWIVLPWLAWRESQGWGWSLLPMLLIAAVVNGLPLLIIIQPRRLRVGPGSVVFSRLLFSSLRWHIRSVRQAIVRRPIVGGGRPLYVWLECEAGKDMQIYRCSSNAEARWLAAELNRTLEVVRALRDEMAET